VQFFAIEFSSAGVAFRQPGKPFELFGICFGTALSGELFQVIAHELVYACTHCIGAPPRLLDNIGNE
jgi:surfactin synthase thioesterase subunit